MGEDTKGTLGDEKTGDVEYASVDPGMETGKSIDCCVLMDCS